MNDLDEVLVNDQESAEDELDVQPELDLMDPQPNC